MDNDTHRVDFVRLGVVSQPEQVTLGSHCLDHFESRRTTYIGPASGVTGCSGETLGPETLSADLPPLRLPDIPLTTTLFADGFETGDFSAWSGYTQAADLTITTTAALRGTYGLAVVVNAPKPLMVWEETPNGETTYQARFYLDPNGLWLNGGNHTLFRGDMEPGKSVLTLDLGHQPGATEYQLSLTTRLEDGEWLFTPAFALSDAPHAVEIGWGMASAPGMADGWLRFWLDGEFVYEHTQVANYGMVIDRVEMGAVHAPLPGSLGTYCLDEFVSTAGAYIGTLISVNGCGQGGAGMPTGAPPSALSRKTPFE